GADDRPGRHGGRRRAEAAPECCWLLSGDRSRDVAGLRGRGGDLRELVQGPRRPDAHPDPKPARPPRRATLRLRDRRPLLARPTDHLASPAHPAGRAIRPGRAARHLGLLRHQPGVPGRVPRGGATDHATGPL
ncbi:MAG: hypothetical protein AVDCRST_MAG70-248, partial [uncultured Thermomicrobiales bacterium]